MGCLSSKEDADDFDRPNIFQVVNIDDAGDELQPAKLEITDEFILLHQRGRTAVQWPIPCLKRYGYSEGVFSFELGRRSPTGAGIYAFKCHRAEELIQLLQWCLKRRVLDSTQLPSTAAASTMALSGSIDQLSAVSPAQSTLNTDAYSGDTVAGDATYVNEDSTVLSPISLRVPPVPAQRRSRPVHNYLNTASVSDDGRPLPHGDGEQPPLYVNVIAQQGYVNLTPPTCGVNYAVLDLQRDGAIVASPLHQPPSLGYATIDFDKTVALSRAVGDRTCTDVEATRRSRHDVDDVAIQQHGSMIN